MKVKKDWWKDFFNHIYLITDSRSVCDSHLTCKEVDLIESFLNLNKNNNILDLCGGQGRHSLELARRGYRNLTVLDFSGFLINLGKQQAKKEGLKVKFVRRDSRTSKLKSNHYCRVFIMSNSFGYFPDERENIRILKETYRILKRGGKLLLDLCDADYVKNKLTPISLHEACEDVIVLRQRKLENGIITAREIVVSKKNGLLRDGTYCEKLYNKNKITQLLKKVGFTNISLKNLSLHKDKKDYGFLTSRMFIKATKP